MRVWDFPLRLFHWALFVSIIGAIISAKAGVLWVHERFGLTVLGLIIFRFVWGFVGGHYSRFRQFLATPRMAFQELQTLFKSTPEPGIKSNIEAKLGHSALGSYAVLFCLAFRFLWQPAVPCRMMMFCLMDRLHIWCRMSLIKPQPRITLAKNCCLSSCPCILAPFFFINTKRNAI